MSRERRRQQRLDANLFAELHDPATDDTLGRGVVVDVSLGGMAVETEANLEIPSRVGCYVEIPFFVRAEIVRRETKGNITRYGLRFAGQTFIDKLLLKKLLRGKRKTKKV